MKKLLLVLSLAIVTLTTYSQKRHTPYAYAGPSFGLSDGSVGFCAEVGNWSLDDAKFTYGVDVEFSSGSSIYTGPKVYYTVASTKNGKLMLMPYVNPLFRLSGSGKGFAMEEGLNGYWEFTRKAFLSVAPYLYHSNGTSAGLSVGIVLIK